MNSQKLPKNDSKYHWTLHSKYKLMQYNLSPNVINRIVRFPERTETGIAPDTIAVMKSKGKDKNYKEIWVMYQKKGNSRSSLATTVTTNLALADKQEVYEKLNGILKASKKKIISVWIYPGKSPKGKQIYVPDEVWTELSL